MASPSLPERMITKEEMASMKAAFLACTAWEVLEERGENGVASKAYQGEAESWKFALAKEGATYDGYAWHFGKALEVPLGSNVARVWFRRVRTMLEKRS